MADVAPILNDNSFIEVRPVTLDEDGNPVSYGVPIMVKMSDLAAYFSSAGTIPAATTTTVGGVLEATTVVGITDNSTGTSGGDTIAAVTDVATAADAIATLAAKVNAVIASLKLAGSMDGSA